MSTVYIVTDTTGKESDRLVEAASRAAAVRHCSHYTAKPAAPIAVAQLMKAGIVLEHANAEAEAQAATELR